MSIVERLRHTVRWSNSRQSWEERIGAGILIVAAVCMGVWGTALPTLHQSILWAFLVLTMAFLLRRGWLKLFGPVLFYDMVRLARRGRYFLLRLVYAGILLFFLFITWAEMSRWGGHGGDAQQQYARMAQTYFYQFMIIQLIAVTLLTPAYVGGSISEEKERKTLEFMLATDLRNREIVLSKMTARIANLFMIVLIGLPILSILQFLGGIDPNLLLVGFAATFVTAIGLAGFSMFCSVQFKKSRDAIVCSYLGPTTYIIVGIVLFAVQQNRSWSFISAPFWEGGPSLSSAINVFNSGNVIVGFIHLAESMWRRGGISAVLLTVWRDYTIFHLTVGLLCTVWSVMRLRVIALKQMSESPRKAGKRQRKRPAVGLRPVLWREIYVEGRAKGSWIMRLLIFTLVVLTVGSGIWASLYMLLVEGHFYPRDMNGWVTGMGTVVACLVLLAVSVRASTCISSERDKETFDFLLTTPLDSDTILWHKFFGCLWSLWRGLVWLGAIWGIGLMSGSIYVLDVLALLLTVFIYAFAFIFIGLWFSMKCRSGIRATIWTVSTVVLISVGHWLPSACCLVWASHSDAAENLAQFQAGITPPFVLGYFHHAGFEMREARHWRGDSYLYKQYFACAIGLALYVLAIFVFWFTVLSPRFRTIAHRENRIRPGRRRG